MWGTHSMSLDGQARASCRRLNAALTDRANCTRPLAELDANLPIHPASIAQSLKDIRFARVTMRSPTRVSRLARRPSDGRLQRGHIRVRCFAVVQTLLEAHCRLRDVAELEPRGRTDYSVDDISRLLAFFVQRK
jgi:hypothetical protein